MLMELLGGGMLGVILCIVGLLALGGLAGTIIVLLKLGVVGAYWLKGEEAEADSGDYPLDQSHSVP
jgi:hypothetical protein